MDVVLIILAFICILVGIVGCIIPGLPGLPIAYAGLWVAQATERVDFSWQSLLIWTIVTIVVTVLDYVIPAFSTKYFGGSKYGAWGSILGMIVGLFFGTWGVILGPLVGAILLELLSGKEMMNAVKAGLGSFLGLLFSTILKVICCGLMLLSIIHALW